MPESAVSELFSRHKAQIQLSQTASPCEHRTEHRAERSLKYLERQLDYRILGCAVNKRSAERIAYDHDHRADRNADNRAEVRLVLHKLMYEERDNDRLQTVRHKRDEHRRGIKEEIAEKCTDTADHKRLDRSEQDRRKADNDIVQIQMPARYGHSKRAERNIHRHKHGCYRDIQRC